MRGVHNMKIPFKFLPASWGLKGKSRAIAEAEYNYTGYELKKKLAEIDAGIEKDKLERAMIDIDLEYKLIDQYAADNRIADLEHRNDETALILARLQIDLNHGKITQQDYERKSADLKGEPYMAMPKISWDPVDPSKTYFELDYNEAFVRYLESNNYTGSEEEVINRWLNDVCSSILDEMAADQPDFVRTVRTVRREDGKTEHS